MGLDNGIFKISKKVLPKAGDFDVNDYVDDQIDVCYWRKCWDFRDDVILNVFDDEDDNLYFEVDASNIDGIIDALIDDIVYADEEEGEWITGDWNKKNLGNLLLIKRDIISENPEYVYFFYDSY